MRYVSWNMGCAPKMATYRRTHADAWRYLLDTLRPDVALVQEAVCDVATSIACGGYLVWSEDRGSDSAAAVFVRDGLSVDRIAIRSEGSYVAAVQLALADGPMLVVSVHVGPPSYKKHLRTLVEVLSVAVRGRRFVVGGDLNAARHIDTVYKGRWFTRFFEDLTRREFHDCHWRRHGKEVQSFWGRQAQHPYQCDHFLADAATDDRVVRCDVIDNADVRRFSDHGPIQLETSAH